MSGDQLIANDLTAFCVAFVANIFLIYLIYRKTPVHMKGYSRILLVHTVQDLYYTILQFVTSVEPFSYQGKLVMVLAGMIKHVDLAYSWILFSAVYQCVIIELFLTPIDFIYRYLTVSKNKVITNMQLYTSIGIVYVISIVEAFPLAITVVKYGPTDDDKETMLFTKELQQLQPYSDYMPTFLYSNAETTLFPINVVTQIITSAFIYILIYWLYLQVCVSVKIHILHHKTSKVAQTEQQINRVMFVQFLIPFLGNCLPIMITSMFSILKIDCVMLGMYNRVVCAWLTAIKPLFTICLIPSYRNQIYKTKKSSVFATTVATARINGK
ncbi:unnamed protein product [Bursaphelenchus okinawaensis]|uniref:G_PROTEIN_RECEP_F1_2 domain-containing protein n=1 Tax=Bursaphelenchus okinawaensis TaxID=465554 RepID=A0A811L139_9BILA|nr:unnamed protein product [Bursaphelenchus okinawaensis]CAG9114200.1 unnamed protein product [Bursaphelenchus okinawaensis]